MKSLKLRALTKDGTKFTFEPKDLPVRIWEDSFILSNVKDSPVLLLNSVVRLMDHMDVGEGDTVLIDNQKYTVQYSKGFQFIGESGYIIPSNLVSECTVLSIGKEPTSVLKFHVNGVTFQVSSFLGMYEKNAISSHNEEPFSLNDIRVGAGFNYQCHMLCYGDEVEGYPLEMWHGRPCIKTSIGYVEIPSHAVIGKE